MRRRGRPPYPDILTPREWEVLALLREGLSNEKIAQRLGISMAGAKYHVSEILGKLGVATREEAAAWQPTQRPWWLAAAAPVAFLWRKVSFGWLPGLAAGVVIIPLAMGLGLLVWGLLRTAGDDGEMQEQSRARAPGPLSPPDGAPATPATEVRRADGQIDFGGGLYGGTDWSPDGRSITFIRNGNLYRADAPAFQPYVLVQDAGQHEGPTSNPRWSPDGGRIAYVGMHPGRGEADDDGSNTIWLVDADGSNLRDLLPGKAAQLSVSTAKILHGWLDDDTLAFDEHCGTACQFPFTLDVETSALTDAAPELYGTVYSWSPDGRWLAVENLGGTATVLVYDRRAQQATGLTPPPPRGSPWQWFDSWAPDSSAFLYEETETHGSGFQPPSALHLWDVERREDRVLAAIGAGASWSQDGSLIAYVTEATAERPCGDHGEETACIAVMDVESGEELYRLPGPGAEHLTDPEVDFPAPVFLPDGRLLYGTSQGEVRLAGGAAWDVLLAVERIAGLALSPDGRFVVVAEPLRLHLVPIPPS